MMVCDLKKKTSNAETHLKFSITDNYVTFLKMMTAKFQTSVMIGVIFCMDAIH